MAPLALNDDDGLKAAIMRAIGEPVPLAPEPAPGNMPGIAEWKARQDATEAAERATSASTPPAAPVTTLRDRKALSRALRAAIAAANDTPTNETEITTP